jgi:hypothetical protein|tara:strand:+ start:34 stop:276 length:243 start_codon:yes stop_codon:yes gene_type:complete
MKHITREDFIHEYCDYVVEKMDEETLKNIARVTLIANIKPESTYADWEDYVAQMPSKHTVEDLLALIQPSVNMVANKNEG